ncbi:MAG TPA: hypothetical protein VIE90_07115 [Candidatus Binatia bacterium]|jgi:hypothetical protein
MAEKIVSMHAAYRSGKDVVDGFLSRPMVAKERPAIGGSKVGRENGQVAG